jgi:hypothetical protein
MNSSSTAGPSPNVQPPRTAGDCRRRSNSVKQLPVRAPSCRWRRW